MLHLYVHPSLQILDLHLNDGETLVCTPEHPFFVQGKGIVQAGKLSVGDHLTFDEAAPSDTVLDAAATVSEIDAEKQATNLATATTVYNFEVANTHTYFVGTEHGGVWVHNACGGVYKLVDEDNVVWRTGQTRDLAVRRAAHRLAYPDFDFEAIAETNDYNTRRGLEQMAHDYYDHPPLNVQEPIGPGNENYELYMNAAQEYIDEFGISW